MQLIPFLGGKFEDIAKLKKPPSSSYLVFSDFFVQLKLSLDVLCGVSDADLDAARHAAGDDPLGELVAPGSRRRGGSAGRSRRVNPTLLIHCLMGSCSKWALEQRGPVTHLEKVLA